MEGTLINRVDGEKVVPRQMDALSVGLEVFRNHDHEFEKVLENKVNSRKIELELTFHELPNGFMLSATDEDGLSAEYIEVTGKILAEKPIVASELITHQLEKLGDTRFSFRAVNLNVTNIPHLKASVINNMRRKVIEKLESVRIQSFEKEVFAHLVSSFPFPQKQLTYLGNVSNKLAEIFYKRHGVDTIEPAFEIAKLKGSTTVMTTKHCIRYQMDACAIHQKSTKKLNEPLFLQDNHHTYQLEFDCKQCIMKVILLVGIKHN